MGGICFSRPKVRRMGGSSFLRNDDEGGSRLSTAARFFFRPFFSFFFQPSFAFLSLSLSHPLLSHLRVTPNEPKQASSGGKDNGDCALSNNKNSKAAIVDAAACGGRGEDGGAAEPPDEAERVGFLCGLGILDSPADPRFDDITKLVS